jgi:hypothetical protein
LSGCNAQEGGGWVWCGYAVHRRVGCGCVGVAGFRVGQGSLFWSGCSALGCGCMGVAGLRMGQGSLLLGGCSAQEGGGWVGVGGAVHRASDFRVLRTQLELQGLPFTNHSIDHKLRPNRLALPQSHRVHTTNNKWVHTQNSLDMAWGLILIFTLGLSSRW